MIEPADGEKVIENLIIGSSFAAYAAARALHRDGAAFEVLDVAYDLEPGIAEDVASFAQLPPSEWDEDISRRLFPAAEASMRGVKRRQVFGSSFPYRIPEPFSVRTEDCDTEFSHGLGGFGNVWGAAMLPYNDSELADWPVSPADMAQSYRNVLAYAPLSAERDGLADGFPLYTDNPAALRRSAQTDALLNAFARRRSALERGGAVFGRARVAIDTSQSDTGCRYCGHCLDGCAYGSIFNPGRAWATIPGMEGGGENRWFHRGFYALEFTERSDHVEVAAIDVRSGSMRTWRARRLFLGLGHMGTTRMIARSLKRIGERIRTLDTQYFFFPMLSYAGRKLEPVEYTLAEAFLEISNARISPHKQHVQVYGMNPIFDKMLKELGGGILPMSAALRRFYLFQGYLHSDESGGVDIEIESSTSTRDEIVVRGRQNPSARRIAGKVQSFVRNAMLPFGVVPPGTLSLVPPGRSFHAGGSFPMGGAHPVYSSDALGRPSGLKRVHIVDPASFPSIPSSTISFSIMANADRVVRASNSNV